MHSVCPPFRSAMSTSFETAAATSVGTCWNPTLLLVGLQHSCRCSTKYEGVLLVKCVTIVIGVIVHVVVSRFLRVFVSPLVAVVFLLLFALAPRDLLRIQVLQWTVNWRFLSSTRERVSCTFLVRSWIRVKRAIIPTFLNPVTREQQTCSRPVPDLEVHIKLQAFFYGPLPCGHYS